MAAKLISSSIAARLAMKPPKLDLALILHEQVSRGLATPERRGLDERGDHGRHHAGSAAQDVREVSRCAPKFVT